MQNLKKYEKMNKEHNGHRGTFRTVTIENFCLPINLIIVRTGLTEISNKSVS